MVAMPSVLTIIVCQVFLGPMDDNSRFTGWRSSTFDTTDGIMHCRRHEIELYDPTVDMGADPRPFTPFSCMQAAMRLGPNFDVDRAQKEKDLPLGAKGMRFWRAACPVPIMDDNGTPNDDRDDRIVGWKIPDCGTLNGTIICEMDSAI